MMKNNLKKLRLDNNISQVALSRATGISSQMISDYEHNRSNMSIERIIKLADYFNTTIDYLIGRNKKMKPVTVKELFKECEVQMKKGNSDKVILLSDDDEGNGYHYMWYLFSTVSQAYAQDSIDEKIAKEEDTIILG